MKSETPLDYAVFELSPKRSRCELFVSGDGSTEKLASGLVKPFVAHLRVAEEQAASAAQLVRLEVGQRSRRNAEAWFTKGTLERFVRFVSTPEVLEVVITLDAEMSQLEAARRIYSQGAGDQTSGTGGGGSEEIAADDAAKKELLRAIDVRLIAVRQDLSNASARAAAAGFNVDTVSDLQMFADRFGAHRLNVACGKFMSLSERRAGLINTWKSGTNDRALRSSFGSDMSIDNDSTSPTTHQDPSTCQQPNPPPITFPLRRTLSGESSVEKDNVNKPNDGVQQIDKRHERSTPDQSTLIHASQSARRLSVLDRINMFENKQKENSGGKPPAVIKSVDLRRISSDAAPSAAKKAALRRWSGPSDMGIDFGAEKKDTESPLTTPASAADSQDKRVLHMKDNIDKSSSVIKPEIMVIPSLAHVSDIRLKGGSVNNSEQFPEASWSDSNLASSNTDGLKDQLCGKARTVSSICRAEESSKDNFKTLIGTKNEGVGWFGDQGKLKGSHSGEEQLSGSWTQMTGVEEPSSSLTQTGNSGSKGGKQFEISKQDSESRVISVKQIYPHATQKTVVESGLSEGGSGSRIQETFQCKGMDRDSSYAHQELRSLWGTGVSAKKESRVSEKVSSTSISSAGLSSVGETEVSDKKETWMSEKVANIFLSSSEDSEPQKLKFRSHGLAAELSKKIRVQQEKNSFSGNSRTQFSGKVAIEAQEGFDYFSTPTPEQDERVRQSKGTQELNDELKMKANELEKLFAEHKLRAPGVQLNSARKGSLGDKRHIPRSSSEYSKLVTDITSQLSDSCRSPEPSGSSRDPTNSNAASFSTTTNSQYHGDALNKKFSELSFQEGSRGKSYDRYMQKRDAKLKKEWSSNRTEKEARLKSMQDSVERSKSEMKVKILGSEDRQKSVSSARKRAERLKLYNNRSIMTREQDYQGPSSVDF